MRRLLLHPEIRAPVELVHDPRPKPRGVPCGKAEGVTAHLVRLTRQHAGNLVMPVAVSGSAAENADDDMRPERADDGHHVPQQRIP